MKIRNILNELKLADENAQILCSVPSVGLESRIYIVGQVHTNVPGVTLGDRELHLREKSVGAFISELKTFGSRFQESEFLMESTHDLNEEEYEVRYYKLTHIKISAREVVFHSEEGEVLELREVHREPES